MIVVCEPFCKGMSHEKVNSGFLTALRMAYPKEELCFYAPPSHLEAIQAILAYDHAVVAPISYRPIEAEDGLRGLLPSYLRFRRWLLELDAMGVDQVLFLSFSPGFLHILKRLKEEKRLSHFKLAFVLHGDFDSIAGKVKVEAPSVTGGADRLLEKVRSIPLRDLPRRAGVVLSGMAAARVRAMQASLVKSLFDIKKQMLWRHSKDYRYVALSPHIVANARKYLDVEGLNITAVDMPINFAPPLPAPRNDHIKFATFGYGDPASLQRVVRLLDEQKIDKPYEIRIIGMDDGGLRDHPHVTCPSPGKALARPQMEKLAVDIDAFLIFYGKERYRLSCSGAILEALSYVKPVLHLDNDCINHFDRPSAPIGFCCDSLEELAMKMKDLIERYADYGPELETRRQNILTLRRELSIENLGDKVRSSLTFDHPMAPSLRGPSAA
jgi:hypothetical protein